MPVIGEKTNVNQKSTGVEVEESSTAIVAENEGRGGLELVNDSGATVYLGLGKAAVLKQGQALAPKGSWDGRVGAKAWFGAVNGIATAPKSVVTVVEV